MPVKNLREDRRPADLWFWNDWFSSFDVRSCSLAARGLWIDMLGVMRNAEVKGALTVNGKQIGIKELTNITGASEKEVAVLLKELEDHEVFSRLEDGTIINRRMYREGELSQKRAIAGRKGMAVRYQADNNILTALGSNKPLTTLEDEDEESLIDSSSDKKAEKPVFNFSSRSWENITDADIAEWQEAFPACDIKAELSKMKVWILANPKKGKKSNYRKFIVGWINRTQDAGGTKNGSVNPRVMSKEEFLAKHKAEAGR